MSSVKSTHRLCVRKQRLKKHVKRLMDIFYSEEYSKTVWKKKLDKIYSGDYKKKGE